LRIASATDTSVGLTTEVPMRSQPIALVLSITVLVSFILGCASLPARSNRVGLRTSSGWVTTPAMDSDEWSCAPKEEASHGVRAEMINCTLSTPGTFFFLTAKDYSVPPGHALPAETLATEVYLRQYRSMFSNVQVGSSTPTLHRGRTGWDTSLSAVSQSRGAISKVERVIVAGDHVINLSGEGHPDDVIARQGDITRWFAETRFPNL